MFGKGLNFANVFFQPFGVKLAGETDPDKLAMYKRMNAKVTEAIKNMETAVNNGSDSTVEEARKVTMFYEMYVVVM